MKHTVVAGICLMFLALAIAGCGVDSPSPWAGGHVDSSVLATRIRYGANGAVFNYTQMEYDGNGRVQFEFLMSGAGADGVWFTNDDVISTMTSYTYDADGHVQLRITYNNPGADGQWRTTSDNIVASYRRYTHSFYTGTRYYQERRYVTYTGAGANGIWFDGDDVISSWNKKTYRLEGMVTNPDDDQHALVDLNYFGAGINATWLDSDDVGSGFVYSYDLSGNQIIKKNVTGIGADGVLGTGDDLFAYYYRRYYGPDGLRVRSVRYDSTNTITRYWERTYDTNRQVSTITQYISAGADLTWLTGDDAADEREVWVFDALGKPQTHVVYGRGGDLTVGTPDDTVTRWEQWLYDSNGVLLEYNPFDAAGADGAWFTVDDYYDNSFTGATIHYREKYQPMQNAPAIDFHSLFWDI